MKLKKSTTMDAIMIKTALQWKIRNPGMSNARVEMMLQSCCRDNGDMELVKLCYQMMQDISLKERNAHFGQWSWRQTAPDNDMSYQIMSWISNVVGCWSNCDGGSWYFYTNQNHSDWISW